MGKSSLLLRYYTVTAATLFSFSEIFSGTFQVPYMYVPGNKTKQLQQYLFLDSQMTSMTLNSPLQLEWILKSR